MKTNAMRLLDQKKITYKVHDYVATGAVSGLEVAEALNQKSTEVFKTLVTVSKSKNHYVFIVPVCSDLDLKKAAKAVNEKSVEMIKSKDLLALTGYVHGGCSPIGMKKVFTTVIDESVKDLATFYISGGKVGYQIEISLTELEKVLKFSLANICSTE